jgi:hypothetical protein
MAEFKSPLLQALDPAVAAIFDAMTAFMGTTYTSCNTSIARDAMATTQTINATDVQGSNYNVSARIAGPRVSITPLGANLGPNGTQQFTASGIDSSGNPVTDAFTWSISPLVGTIDQTGLYQAPAAITMNNSVTVTATLTGSLSATSVMVTLHP